MHLDAMNRLPVVKPWPLSFSFGRALQARCRPLRIRTVSAPFLHPLRTRSAPAKFEHHPGIHNIYLYISRLLPVRRQRSHPSQTPRRMRSAQATAIKRWGGKATNVPAAQEAYLARCRVRLPGMPPMAAIPPGNAPFLSPPACAVCCRAVRMYLASAFLATHPPQGPTADLPLGSYLCQIVLSNSDSDFASSFVSNYVIISVKLRVQHARSGAWRAALLPQGPFLPAGTPSGRRLNAQLKLFLEP